MYNAFLCLQYLSLYEHFPDSKQCRLRSGPHLARMDFTRATCRLDLGQNYVAVWVKMTWLKCFFIYKSGHSRFCIAFPCCWLCFSFRLLFSKTWLDPHWWILLCHSAIITGDNGCCSSPAQTCWINTGSGEDPMNTIIHVTNGMRSLNQNIFWEFLDA